MTFFNEVQWSILQCCLSLCIRILVYKSQYATFTDVCIFGEFCSPEVHNSSPKFNCLGKKVTTVCHKSKTTKYWLWCIKSNDCCSYGKPSLDQKLTWLIVLCSACLIICAFHVWWYKMCQAKIFDGTPWYYMLKRKAGNLYSLKQRDMIDW